MTPPDGLQIALTLSTLMALWIGWAKAVRPKVRRFRARWNQAGDALLGREPIIDPASGRELAPALPGIGQRMATVEDAVKILAEAQARSEALSQRLSRVETQVSTNTENIATMMVAAAERIVTKEEAAQMWRAIADRDVIDGDEPDGA